MQVLYLWEASHFGCPHQWSHHTAHQHHLRQWICGGCLHQSKRLVFLQHMKQGQTSMRQTRQDSHSVLSKPAHVHSKHHSKVYLGTVRGSTGADVAMTGTQHKTIDRLGATSKPHSHIDRSLCRCLNVRTSCSNMSVSQQQ